jgi:hypothetical protein
MSSESIQADRHKRWEYLAKACHRPWMAIYLRILAIIIAYYSTATNH